MTRLSINGMSCMHCVKTVTDALSGVKGVEGVPEVTLQPGGAVVRGSASPEDLIVAVEEAGYKARIDV